MANFSILSKSSYGPDRLELIIFDITGKKIDNHRSRLIIEFSSIMLLSAKGLRVCLIAKR